VSCPIWSRTNPAENNLIDIAARCLLIEDGNRLILIDTGMGNKQSESFLAIIHCGVTSMDKSLAKYGFHRDDVTDVFDICILIIVVVCSGMQKKTGYEPAFKNAKFWINEAIGNGQQTEPSEKNIFLSETFCQCDGQLNFKRPTADFLENQSWV
jgi:hypothetical protein